MNHVIQRNAKFRYGLGVLLLHMGLFYAVGYGGLSGPSSVLVEGYGDSIIVYQSFSGNTLTAWRGPGTASGQLIFAQHVAHSTVVMPSSGTVVVTFQAGHNEGDWYWRTNLGNMTYAATWSANGIDVPYDFRVVSLSENETCPIYIRTSGGSDLLVGNATTTMQDMDGVISGAVIGDSFTLVLAEGWTFASPATPPSYSVTSSSPSTWRASDVIRVAKLSDEFIPFTVELNVIETGAESGRQARIYAGADVLMVSATSAAGVTVTGTSSGMLRRGTLMSVRADAGGTVTSAPSNTALDYGNTHFAFTVTFSGTGGTGGLDSEGVEKIVEAIESVEEKMTEGHADLKKAIEDGAKTIVESVDKNTEKNAENTGKIVDAVGSVETAIKSEGAQLRTLTADQFGNLISAVNSGNSNIVGAILGSRYNDARVVAGIEEVRDEVAKLNKKIDDAGENLEGIRDDMESDGARVTDSANTQGTAVNQVLNKTAVAEGSEIASVAPTGSVRVGKHEITFSPFAASSPVSWVGDFLRALRKLIVWSLVVGIFILVVKQLGQMLSDIMKTGKHVSGGGLIAAPAAFGIGGPVAGAAIAAAGLVVMLAAVATLPVIGMAIMETSVGKVGDASGIVSSASVAFFNDVAGNHSVVAQGLWYADQVVPLAMCLMAPVYYLTISKLVIPSSFVAQVVLRFFPF